MLRFATRLSAEECRRRVGTRAGRARGLAPVVIGRCRGTRLRLRYRGRLRHTWAPEFRGRILHAAEGAIVHGAFVERVWVRLVALAGAAAGGTLALAVLGWSAAQFWRAPSWFEFFAAAFLACWVVGAGVAAAAAFRCWRRLGLKDRLELLRFLRRELGARRTGPPREAALRHHDA